MTRAISCRAWATRATGSLEPSDAPQTPPADYEGHYMKPIAVEELSNGIESLLKEAQKERVLLTRQGKPCAVLFGLENLDEEDWQLARSADFWQMIQERRKGPLIPLV